MKPLRLPSLVRLLILLRRLRPATMRLRMTLFASVVTLIPLTVGAITAGASVRTDLQQEISRIVDYEIPNERPGEGIEKEIMVLRKAGGCYRTPEGDLLCLREDGEYIAVVEADIPACGPSITEFGENGMFRWELRVCTPEQFPESSPPNFYRTPGRLSLKPWTNPVHHDPNRPYLYQLRPTGNSDRSFYAMIISEGREQARLNTVIWQLFGGVAAITGLVAGITWFAVGRVLRPVEAIRAEFAELSAHHLDRRVPVPRTGNEIARLAATMNTTLHRLQTAVEQQRQFTADASHELRTPLASLRIELELALNRPDAADWPRVVYAAHEDTIRVQELTEDLLLLARLDAEHTDRQPQRTVDLTDLVREETARRRPPRGLRLHVHARPEPVTVQGHPALLARVLGNLLDNAERHATTTIDVRLTHDTDRHEAAIDVLDDGSGIPPDDRQRIFERFTRLDNARSRDTGGVGLGLAIAQRITTTHHGTLTLTPSTTGAHFTLRLPSTATGPP